MARNLLLSLKNIEPTSTKRHFTLTEIVGIMALIDEGMNLDEIAKLTKRSRSTLNYKFRENDALIKGVRMTRSIKKYKTMEDLYAGEDPTATYSEEDMDRRIQEFKASIFGSNSSVV